MTLKHFRAVTETGKVYLYTGGSVLIYDEDVLVETVRAVGFSVLVYDDLVSAAGEGGVGFWPFLHALPRADAPEVGKSMYISNSSSWKVSTPVMELEILDN